MQRKIARYGWVPDLPDHRDHLYTAPSAKNRALPTKVDLRRHCPPVLDQAGLGSCTAHTIANAHYFEQLRQGISPPSLPSRLFIYYNQREMTATTGLDSGAMLRDGIKSIVRLGACSENRWPYDIARFAQKPSPIAYKEANRRQPIRYQRIPQNLNLLTNCLAEGRPFLFGFTAYESLESPHVSHTGNVPLPTSIESPIGGHAALAVGYDDIGQTFIFMNSWGSRWGERGFGYIPYAYLLEPGLAKDFWVIRADEYGSPSASQTPPHGNQLIV